MQCVWQDQRSISHVVILNCNQTLNANLYFQQQQPEHENQRKRFILINGRNVVLHHDTAKLDSARIKQEKNLGSLPHLIHHIHQTLHQVISIFSVLNKMFWTTKKILKKISWKSWRKSSSTRSQQNFVWVKTTSYVVPSINFQTFFVEAFKIVVDSWKFSMLLLYILWDDWLISMISASNEQLQQQLEYTLLKPNCHSWWISKM